MLKRKTQELGFKIQNTKIFSAENRHIELEYFAWARKTTFLLIEKRISFFFTKFSGSSFCLNFDKFRNTAV